MAVLFLSLLCFSSPSPFLSFFRYSLSLFCSSSSSSVLLWRLQCRWCRMAVAAAVALLLQYSFLVPSLSLLCFSGWFPLSSSVFFFSFLPLFYKPSLMLFSAFSSPFRSISKSLVLSLPHGFLSIICQPPPLFSSFFFFPLLPLSSYCSSSIYSP